MGSCQSVFLLKRERPAGSALLVPGSLFQRSVRPEPMLFLLSDPQDSYPTEAQDALKYSKSHLAIFTFRFWKFLRIILQIPVTDRTVIKWVLVPKL